MRPPTTALFLLAWTMLSGCGAGPERQPPIVLISIDTLRSDHLPVYGYDGVRTPAIDALAADSIVFEHAFSHYPLTLPAHASMLTGLLPPDHGVRGNLGYRLAGEKLPNLLRSLSAGRAEQAEHELRREIERRPSALRAYSRLAQMLARQGRREEAVSTIRALAEANPNPAGFAAAARTLNVLGDPSSAGALVRAAMERFPGDPQLERMAAVLDR